jgi:hypothetical protein
MNDDDPNNPLGGLGRLAGLIIGAAIITTLVILVLLICIKLLAWAIR